MSRNFIKVLLSCLIVLFMLLGLDSTGSCLAAADRSAGQILYVKPDQSGDCLSWDTACGLQAAISIAQEGTQIWVAAGTYKPTEDTNRNASFSLRAGVAIYGGFVGTETALSERDWESHTTILSGDIGEVGNTEDNSLQVVACGSMGERPILDGFTITGGNANDWSVFLGNLGGGIILFATNPILTNLIITNNSAQSGGGIYNLGGYPILTNVEFLFNSAEVSGGGLYTSGADTVLTNVRFVLNVAGYGGGMYNSGSATLTNILFDNNHATYGGGLYNSNASPTISNATFWNNAAELDGGALYNNYSSPVLENCTLHSNAAGRSGGGIYNEGSSSPGLVNVTISDNTAYGSSGGSGGGIYNNTSTPTLTNAIVWGNSPNSIFGGSSTVTYSIVQGGFSGIGNLSSDPLLGAIQDNGGYAATRALSTGSPAIDTGNTSVCQNVDQRGFKRPVDGDGNGSAVCDIGAYEYNAVPKVFWLAIAEVGSGIASVSPEQEVYYYGDVVTLTAVPELGWSFSDWSGDLVSNSNPMPFVILGDESVTAKFTEDEYTVTVIPDGHGSVTIDPDQSTYYYGDIVTLTATAELGSEFTAWSGDEIGTSNPMSFVVLGDESITATFTEHEYTLTITILPEGCGSVVIDPEQTSYHYGDSITLTATTGSGSTFDGWSGDATGMDNPLTLTVYGDTEITAEFYCNGYLPIFLH